MGRPRKQRPQAPAGARWQWAADRAMRAPMRSPGRPEPSRAVQREFWRLIASGVTTVQAAEGVGVSWPVGVRWFRHAGGMPPISLGEPTGRYLSFAEREEIALLCAQHVGVRAIARRIGRDPGTVSRELRRNAATRGALPPGAAPNRGAGGGKAGLRGPGREVEGAESREAPEEREARRQR